MNIEAAKSWVRVLGMGFTLIGFGVNAQDIQVSADFTPSLDNPTNNTFTNTTKPGPFCSGNAAACGGNQSIFVVGSLRSQAPFIANDPDPRQGWTIKLPADWRGLNVQHASTGEMRNVELRIIGITTAYTTTPTVNVITGISDTTAAHNALWQGGSFGVAPAPCSATYYTDGSFNNYAEFVWTTPTATPCAKRAAFNIDFIRSTNFEVIYELRTPTPLDMSAGEWKGDLSYSVGSGGDLDFGDNLATTVTSLDLHFTLTVAHHLRVVFPPGADRLALEPEGGWIPWLNGGRRPERIMRDQPFQFTSSGPVKMRIGCQYLQNGNCAISNARRHVVPVETRITLPAGMQAETGGPISKALLTSSNDLTALADRYVANATGTLHFEVARSDVDAMLAYPDTTYSGNVTVVWDSFLIP